jgi:hypothetical protein
VIEDLEGATSEPSRRTHAAVLSASVAAVSLVLFYMLVAPPIFDGAPPQAASPSLRPSFVMTVAPNSVQRLPLGLTPSRMCDSAAWGEFQLGVPATGAWLPTVVYERTGRFPVASVREERGTGRLILTCTSPDSFIPRIDRAR